MKLIGYALGLSVFNPQVTSIPGLAPQLMPSAIQKKRARPGKIAEMSSRLQKMRGHGAEQERGRMMRQRGLHQEHHGFLEEHGRNSHEHHSMYEEEQRRHRSSSLMQEERMRSSHHTQERMRQGMGHGNPAEHEQFLRFQNELAELQGQSQNPFKGWSTRKKILAGAITLVGGILLVKYMSTGKIDPRLDDQGNLTDIYPLYPQDDDDDFGENETMDDSDGPKAMKLSKNGATPLGNDGGDDMGGLAALLGGMGGGMGGGSSGGSNDGSGKEPSDAQLMQLLKMMGGAGDSSGGGSLSSPAGGSSGGYGLPPPPPSGGGYDGGDNYQDGGDNYQDGGDDYGSEMDY